MTDFIKNPFRRTQSLDFQVQRRCTLNTVCFVVFFFIQNIQTITGKYLNCCRAAFKLKTQI